MPEGRAAPGSNPSSRLCVVEGLTTIGFPSARKKERIYFENNIFFCLFSFLEVSKSITINSITIINAEVSKLFL